VKRRVCPDGIWKLEVLRRLVDDEDIGATVDIYTHVISDSIGTGIVIVGCLLEIDQKGDLLRTDYLKRRNWYGWNDRCQRYGNQDAHAVEGAAVDWIIDVG
jgi:hypothetical protein